MLPLVLFWIEVPVAIEQSRLRHLFVWYELSFVRPVSKTGEVGGKWEGGQYVLKGEEVL